MVFYYDYAAVLGLCAAILLITAWAYWRVAKPYANFPSYWIVSDIIRRHLKGQIPRNIMSTEFYFQYFIDAVESYRPEGLVVLWLPYPYLIVFTEQAAKTFLHSEVSNDKAAIYKDLRDLLGDGLVTSNGGIWMKHRKMLNPAFHTDMLKGRIATFNESADALVKELSDVGDKSCVDIYEYLIVCSFQVLSESVLGLKGMDKQTKETLRVSVKKLTKVAEITAYRIIFPWWRSDFIFSLTSVGKEYKKLCDDWNNITRKVILEIKESISSLKPEEAEPTEHTENRKSFARILLDYSMKDPSFTLKDVEDQVKTFMVAGSDTVATTMMWCLYLLGLHPEVQEQAYNEVISVTDEFVTYEQLCELKYLERVILETLRLYPAIPAIAREVKREVQLEKYKVPKGANMVFFAYAYHRNPEIFPDPEKFDPDRFIVGSSGTRPYSYMPFGEGTRYCIGQKFAMLEMKVTLSHVLRNFKVTSLKKREDIKIYWLIALMPTQPVCVQLKPRHPPH